MTFNIEADKLKKVKVEVRSSVIDFMEYSQVDFALTVQYKSRGVFRKKVKRFEEVTLKQFFDLLNSESVGKSFMRLINDKRMSKCY